MDGRSPAELVPALAEPTQRVAPRWIGLLVLANLAVWMGFFTPIQVLLPEPGTIALFVFSCGMIYRRRPCHSHS